MGLHQYYPSTAHNYPYELNKDFVFSAAHFVPHEGAGGCSRVHGHNYTVNLTIVGDSLDEMGFLANFSELKKLVHKRYDHTLMNDHKEYTHDFNHSPDYFPTTEVVAENIYRIVQKYLYEKENRPQCIQVIVRETDTSYVVYRPTRG
jgi:6-pyruvoyltetrahydropterin/6-carboxytetrahydropterin synthase